ncbi:hypothetical protein ABGB14_45500 [Nonomuraea sp. B10E15]|uniref:hypothetical protein n=1 Tax=Nonomuraea sp. B10E15 TaxID=3153560 RepID=UPI00325D2E67
MSPRASYPTIQIVPRPRPLSESSLYGQQGTGPFTSYPFFPYLSPAPVQDGPPEAIELVAATIEGVTLVEIKN